jgi:hypothetical protein
MAEEMMARQGVKMGPAGGVTAKVCMSREMVEKNELPSQQGDCGCHPGLDPGSMTSGLLDCGSSPQ